MQILRQPAQGAAGARARGLREGLLGLHRVTCLLSVTHTRTHTHAGPAHKRRHRPHSPGPAHTRAGPAPHTIPPASRSCFYH